MVGEEVLSYESKEPQKKKVARLYRKTRQPLLYTLPEGKNNKQQNQAFPSVGSVRLLRAGLVQGGPAR